MMFRFLLPALLLTGSTLQAQTWSQQPIAELVEQGRAPEAQSLAESLASAHTGDPRAQFWLALTEPGSAATFSAVAKLRATAAASPWTMLADASVTPLTALTSIHNAMVSAPADGDVAQAAVLTLLVMCRADAPLAPLRQLLDANRSVLHGSAGAALAAAYADEFFFRATGSADERKTALEDTAAVLSRDAANTSAVVLRASLLNVTDPAGAQQYIRVAAAALPTSYPIQAMLYRSLLAGPDRSKAEPEIQTAMAHLLATSRPDLASLRGLYTALSDDTALQQALIGKVNESYPNTDLADAMNLNKALTEQVGGTEESNAQAKITALEAFVAQPGHADKSIMHEAWSDLEYQLSQQPDPDQEMLYRAVEQRPDFSYGLRVLARKRYRLTDLETLATEELNSRWTMLSEQRKTQRDLNGFTGFLLSDYVHFSETTLGLIYLEEGRAPLAENLLTQARALSPGEAETTTLLAQALAAQGNDEKARILLMSALDESSYGLPENPALAALSELYVKQHHGSAGLDAYMRPMLAQAREKRRQAIVAARLTHPRPLPAFHLVDLKGREVSSDSLRGKYVIINFWATWCGPCRQELPGLQRLYTEHKRDANIAILAVATDDPDTPTSTIAAYIERSGFTFPVLRGAQYAAANGISTIPFTWFVDPQGRILYEKLGGTQDLYEEFSWRLDAMMNVNQPK